LSQSFINASVRNLLKFFEIKYQGILAGSGVMNCAAVLFDVTIKTSTLAVFNAENFKRMFAVNNGRIE